MATAVQQADRHECGTWLTQRTNPRHQSLGFSQWAVLRTMPGNALQIPLNQIHSGAVIVNLEAWLDLRINKAKTQVGDTGEYETG